MLETSLFVIAAVFFVIGALPTLYFLLLTIAALFPFKQRQEGQNTNFLILVPAHDEELHIATTVERLKSLEYAAYRVVVVADNCTDNTATIVRNLGVDVIERTGDPGKGQALYDAMTQLQDEPWNAVVIVDADSLLSKNALQVLDKELAAGAEAVQLLYGISNPDESIRTKAMEMGQSSFNGLRPKGRSRLGLSSGIFGNGFCLPRATLQKVPYKAHSIVEDIEYHTKLLQAGIRTYFCDKASVLAKMPTSPEAAEKQRVRWERGRAITINTFAPQLWKEALKGNAMALDALVDIITPPATYIGIPLLVTIILGGTAWKIAALVCIVIMVAHYFISSLKYGNAKNLMSILAFTPGYVAWKIVLLGKSFLTQKRLGWERTDREE